MTDTSSPNLELIATSLERIAATLERIDEKLGESINEHGQVSVIADTTAKLAIRQEIGNCLSKTTAVAVQGVISSLISTTEVLPTP